MQLGFYEVLGCPVTASAREMNRRYRAKALIYHPDKLVAGFGSPLEFRYISMIHTVLKDPTTRAEYDRNGRARWVDEVKRMGNIGQPSAPNASHTFSVPAPPINTTFLEVLLTMRTPSQYYIGDFPLKNYIEANLANIRAEDVYNECKVAEKLGMKLRLVAKGDRAKLPVLPQARVIRYAAFMGVDLLGLGVPSSHGHQAFKYCREHSLPCETLEKAFGSTGKVKEFRASLGISVEAAKDASNLLVGGSGVVKIKSKCGLSELPLMLMRMRGELATMRRHMTTHCPADWKEELKRAKYDTLTLGSWHYQLD